MYVIPRSTGVEGLLSRKSPGIVDLLEQSSGGSNQTLGLLEL